MGNLFKLGFLFFLFCLVVQVSEITKVLRAISENKPLVKAVQDVGLKRIERFEILSPPPYTKSELKEIGEEFQKNFVSPELDRMLIDHGVKPSMATRGELLKQLWDKAPKEDTIYDRKKLREIYANFKDHNGESPELDAIIEESGRTPSLRLRKVVLKQLWTQAEQSKVKVIYFP